MNTVSMAHKLDTYSGLLQQIRSDLRLQHPDWIQPNGECPMCDCYEVRLIKLLHASRPGEPDGNSGAAFCS